MAYIANNGDIDKDKYPFVIDFLRVHRDKILQIAHKHKIKDIMLFGSCARKEESLNSDVDFLVTFEADATLLNQVHLRDELQEFLGKPVDVVSRRGLSPYIGNHIISEAVII